MKSYNLRQRDFWNRDKSNRRDVNHPIVSWIYTRQAMKLKSLISAPIHSILDCGCGNGFFQTFLEKVFQVACVGVDFSAEMLRINPNSQKIQALVTDLPFQDNSFDLVTCSMLLHHLSVGEEQIAMEEMRRVAKKYVFVAEPTRSNFANVVFALMHKEERGLLRFNTAYLRQICLKSGMEVLNAYVDSLLLPNSMPSFLFSAMRKLDTTILSSWFGFNCNVLCRVVSEQDCKEVQMA